MINFGGKEYNIGLNKLDYSFYFDGANINLFNPSNHKGAYMMYGPQDVDIIHGITSKGTNCCFYRNRVYFDFMSKDATVTTNSLFLSNTYKKLDTIDTMTFYGEVINKCFLPSQAVSYDSLNIFHNPNLLNTRDGSKTIKLSAFKDRAKNFEINYKQIKLKLTFSINTPGTIAETDTSLGTLASFLQITFNEGQSLEKIHEWYLIVKKLFQFLRRSRSLI